jgi:SAM-dependent methyltransferase
MKKEFEDQYHAVEAKHWWFRGRREVVSDLVVQTNSDRSCRVLEVGCSAGLLLDELRVLGYGNLTGVDISGEAIELCRARGLSDTHVMDAQRLQFADAAYDLVVASDVLEHLPNAEQAIKEWSRVLRPGGKLIVFVPAFMFLWSEHDEANKHFMRYSRSGLTQLLAGNGFVVERSSYWNSLLLFPISVVRLLRRHLSIFPASESRGDLRLPAGWLNRSLLTLLYWENRGLRSGLNWPLGVSVMSICTKAIGM